MGNQNNTSSPQGGILTSKVGQTDLVLVCNQSSFADLCIEDYKSLCAAFTICATHPDTHRQCVDWLI